MKQFLAYFGLFIGFVAMISGIRFLDDYSRTYQQCAETWRVKIEMAEDKPYMSKHLLENLGTTQIVQGRNACPKLLRPHAEQVRKALEKNL